MCPNPPEPGQIALLCPVAPMLEAESLGDLILYRLPRYLSVWLFLFL